MKRTQLLADISINHNEFIFAQKYRATTLKECILPERIKDKLQAFIDKGDLPNLLFAGSQGIGKTTTALAILNDLGFDVMKINASMDNGIDILRDQILKFASSVSFTEGRKFVVLDEADNLSQKAQEALRAFIEDFSSNCGFIMTCNYPQKLIEPLRKGRFIEVSLNYSKEEKVELLKQTIKRVIEILNIEKVKFEPVIIKNLVVKLYPDIRSILNKLQEHSVTGEINSEALNRDLSRFENLLKMVKDKKFNDMRKWVMDNEDVGFNEVVDSIYRNTTSLIEPQSIPVLIDIINEYDYRNSFVVNKEINLVAMLTKFMSDLKWK